MNYYLSQLGYQGPNSLLLLILIMLLTTNQTTNIYLYIYVFVWQITSHFINIVIKNTLQYPRPDSDENEKFKNLTPTIDNYFSIHKNFGMPSGHAQAVISELTFIALYFKSPIITAISALQSGLTLWQRYATRRHSINQLVVGSAIGIVIGLSFYKIIPFISQH
jgi:membrane-associated phospholipid phosphatase